MEEAKLESPSSHFTPRSMQMILLRLTSISGSVSGSVMETSCQAGARRGHRVTYSFNIRAMTCDAKTAEVASRTRTDCTSFFHTYTHTRK